MNHVFKTIFSKQIGFWAAFALAALGVGASTPMSYWEGLLVSVVVFSIPLAIYAAVKLVLAVRKHPVQKVFFPELIGVLACLAGIVMGAFIPPFERVLFWGIALLGAAMVISGTVKMVRVKINNANSG